MTGWLARKGGMGPDGVYRDPVACVPRFSFVIAEPSVRASQILVISFCLFCSLYAYGSTVLAFLAPAASLASSTLFEKTRYFSPGWFFSQHQVSQSTRLVLGVGCATLLLYAWYSVIRCVAQGYCLPAKLKNSSNPPSWMKGKVAVVTGGNAGIGLATTKQLACWGTHVFIGCRRVEEASDFAQRFLGLSSRNTCQNAATTVDSTEKRTVRIPDESKCKASFSETGSIRVHYLDLLDLESVQAFAEWAIAESGGKIDFLVNNAGIVSTERLTLLLPAVKQANGRIINVSSLAHVAHGPKVRALDYAVSQEAATAVASKLKCPLSQLQGEPVLAQNYDSRRVYGDTKLFNIWFTKALQRRMAVDKERTVTAYAVHPGVVNTDLMSHYCQGTTNWLSCPLKNLYRMVAPLITKTPEAGAATQLMLCVTDQQQLKPGAFYKDGVNSWVDPMALDEKKQEELWDISMLMCQPYLSGRSSTTVPPEGQKAKGKGKAA